MSLKNLICSFEEIIKKKEGFRPQKAVIIPRQVRQNQVCGECGHQKFYLTHIGHYPKAQLHYREPLQGAAQHIMIYCQDGREL
ncbi:MAG: hypothetical protein ABI325_10205 [Ginsengibacter sp.]